MQVNHVRSNTFLHVTICVQIGRWMLPYTGRMDLRGPRALFLLTAYLVSSGGRRLALVRVIGFWAGASGTAAQAGVGSGPQVLRRGSDQALRCRFWLRQPHLLLSLAFSVLCPVTHSFTVYSHTPQTCMWGRPRAKPHGAGAGKLIREKSDNMAGEAVLSSLDIYKWHGGN